MSTPPSSPTPPLLGTTRVVEVRPGEGGADAAAFAHELVEALLAWVRRSDVACTTRERERTTELHLVVPDGVDLARLAGVHRVQRIPIGERAGRRHTSTATIAVLVEEEAPPSALDPDEVRVDYYRAKGPGGQHRNTSDTAVRLTHRPTRTVVTASRSRSRPENQAAAWAELERRLDGAARETRAGRRQDQRRRHVLTPDRSAKAWTWNHQRGTVVEHATGATYALADLARGRLDEIVRG